MVVADIVVELLLQSLSLVADEVKSLWGLNSQIESMYNEMKINIFLKSSQGKRNDPIVKEVVNQIRDVTYKAEDVVDRYTAEVSQKKRRGILKKLFHIIHHVRMLHGVNAEIGNIRSSIDEIYKNKERYNIGKGEFISADNEASELLRKRRRNVEEEYVMHDSRVIIEELNKRHSRRSVVSIIGMGGLGKTTLAQKIYNNDEVKQLFPLRAWGYVSDDYRPKELLLSLLTRLTSSKPKYNGFNEEQLKEEVIECLKGKKYLIVLDDIWRNEVWDDIQNAFPDDPGRGSRILLTSRNKEVASHAEAVLAYDLPFLDKEDSWKLFSKKVFQGEKCPSYLEPMGRSVVESCGGLPLAIIVLAGVAKKKKSLTEWSTIKDHVNWHLARDKSNVMDILKLSYDNLPPRLKPCFLYFAMYPEDYEVLVKQLIHLWIAEGFIQVTGGNSNPPEPDVVADYYLEELVDLSLIQVASKRSDGGVKTCRIHDLLRELCISECKDNKFLNICTSTSSNPRRLSCQCRRHCISLTKSCQLCTRSFILFDEEGVDLGMKRIPKRLELAHVLDFGSSWILSEYDLRKLMNVSKLMSKLIHLRYLRINFGRLAFQSARDVVEDILGTGCLPNLETLHVRGLEYMFISNYGRLKFKRMRHFNMDGVMKLVTEHMSESGDETILDLQTLRMVNFDPETMSMVNKRFPKLRKLGLVADESGKFQSLGPLSNLRTLKIRNSLDLPSDAVAFLSNLTKITLVDWVRFESHFMNTFGQLTNLQVLKLKVYYHLRDEQLGFDINCAAGEFLKLEVFKMEEIKAKSWTLERGAMPHLQRLVINVSRTLTKLPEELWFLTTLREVQVLGANRELKNSLQNVEVKNECKLIID